MLEPIIDESQIDFSENDRIREELDIDLERLAKYDFRTKAPEGANACQVTISPSKVTWGVLYRFRFEIQYGTQAGDEFTPIGEPIKTQSERLPYR